MMRPRVNDYNNGYNHHHHHHQQQQQHHQHHNNNNNHNQHHQQHHHPVIANKGKQLMSFQSYVRTLNNSIDENAAFKKYKDFMANLSQSKVGRFFDANKDREWFRLKYHPTESQKTLSFQIATHQKRLDIFNQLNARNYFDELPFVNTHSPAIINLMDAISVQLSGGPQELVERLLLAAQNQQTPDADLEQQRLKYIPQTPTSVLIDDISIETTIAEMRELCTQADPNLQRITALDPYYVEGGHLRRKFLALYEYSVNIKDVCWKLSRTKLDGKLLNVHINKCLRKRIHTIGAIANDHLCLVNDIRNAITLILNFDELKGLNRNKELISGNDTQEPMDTSENVKPEPDHDTSMESVDNVAPSSPLGSEKSNKEEEDEKPFDVSTLDEEREKERKKVYEFKFNIDLSIHALVSMINKSSNPLLEGAFKYLIEFIESSSQKYQLSKVPAQLQQDPTDINLDSSDDHYQILNLIARNLPCSKEDSRLFLDKLLWYLRIVHSYDYYKKVVYKQEDELTLRMGVIHVRDDPNNLPEVIDEDLVKSYLEQSIRDLKEFGVSQSQKYITKDEERFNYKSYGKVITDELASYSQRIQKPKISEVEEVYKCKHCTKVFQKMSDIGRHFIGKHRWALDAIELETDFFNAYLFDQNKINPCPPKELLEVPTNKYVRLTNFSQMGEDPDLLQEAIRAYSKMESFVREPAPRAQVDTDPRNNSIVDYGDISFDDAI